MWNWHDRSQNSAMVFFFFFFLHLHSDETFLIGFWWKSKCFIDHFRLLHHLTLQIFNICFINVKKVVLCRISGAFCFNGTHSQMSLKSCWSVITQNILESNASISSSFFLFFFAIEAKIDRGKNVRWKKLTRCKSAILWAPCMLQEDISVCSKIVTPVIG